MLVWGCLLAGCARAPPPEVVGRIEAVEGGVIVRGNDEPFCALARKYLGPRKCSEDRPALAGGSLAAHEELVVPAAAKAVVLTDEGRVRVSVPGGSTFQATSAVDAYFDGSVRVDAARGSTYLVRWVDWTARVVPATGCSLVARTRDAAGERTGLAVDVLSGSLRYGMREMPIQVPPPVVVHAGQTATTRGRPSPGTPIPVYRWDVAPSQP